MRRLGYTFIAAVMNTILVATGPTLAQQSPSPPDPAHELLTYFYKDPRPERLVGFFEKFTSSTPPGKWDAYPPVAGFFAIVFRSHPAWTERLVPARLDPKTADTVSAALRLSNRVGSESLQARIREAGSDERLKFEFAALPTRLEDLRITLPTHLDLLWGASFASGDGRYANIIADFFARTANRSDAIAIDVLKTAVAQMGGPKEIIGQLRGKYGDAPAREIIYAAVALWALQSNARQHPFVDQVVVKYTADHPGTPATKVLSAMRPRTRTHLNHGYGEGEFADATRDFPNVHAVASSLD